MHTIDLTPSPAQAARTIAFVAVNVHGLNIDSLSPYTLLVAWQKYEQATDALGVAPSDGTKSLHKEILRETLKQAAAEVAASGGVFIHEFTSYADLNAKPDEHLADTVIVQATAADMKVLRHEG